MTTEQNAELNQLLENIVGELEIPAYIMDNLQRSYETLGEVLNASDDDELKGHKVAVHYQGSIGLGTAIRPQNEDDDVDVDMICEVHSIAGWTQKKLKNAVGERLKSREIYRRLLDEEGTRCWKLRYRQNSDRAADKYHVDILPATVPGEKSWTERLNGFNMQNPEWENMLLYITDNKRFDYATSTYIWNWLKSNPLAYRLWFEIQGRRGLVGSTKSLRASLDPFPKSTEKNTLQKVVMLLKRHRDIKYGGNEDKPISCIITTLAALAYNGEPDIVSAMNGVAKRMRRYILFDGENYRVENPVNRCENFADKWAFYPNRKRIFFEWLSEIELDFGRNELLNKTYIERVKGLKTSFGDTIVIRAVNKMEENMRELQDKGSGGVIKKTGVLTTALGSSTVLSSGATFFGTDAD